VDDISPCAALAAFDRARLAGRCCIVKEKEDLIITATE